MFLHVIRLCITSATYGILLIHEPWYTISINSAKKLRHINDNDWGLFFVSSLGNQTEATFFCHWFTFLLDTGSNYLYCFSSFWLIWLNLPDRSVVRISILYPPCVSVSLCCTCSRPASNRTWIDQKIQQKFRLLRDEQCCWIHARN